MEVEAEVLHLLIGPSEDDLKGSHRAVVLQRSVRLTSPEHNVRASQHMPRDLYKSAIV